jgi:hypothetical protein
LPSPHPPTAQIGPMCHTQPLVHVTLGGGVTTRQSRQNNIWSTISPLCSQLHVESDGGRCTTPLATPTHRTALLGASRHCIEHVGPCQLNNSNFETSTRCAVAGGGAGVSSKSQQQPPQANHNRVGGGVGVARITRVERPQHSEERAIDQFGQQLDQGVP